MLLAGTLGPGKTLAAETIAFAAQCRGSLVVDFDPKPTTASTGSRRWPGRSRCWSCRATRATGKLDPLAIGLRSCARSWPPATSWTSCATRRPPGEPIDRAVRDAVRAEERSLLAVIARLRESEAEAAREVAEALEVLSDFGLGAWASPMARCRARRPPLR